MARSSSAMSTSASSIVARTWSSSPIAGMTSLDVNDRDSQATLRAAVWTALLAAPLPLAIHFGSELLAKGVDSIFVFSASRALGFMVPIAVFMETGRQLLTPHGLAESHFRWPARVTRRIHRGLLVPEFAFLAIIFVALQLGAAGMRLNSPANSRPQASTSDSGTRNTALSC